MGEPVGDMYVSLSYDRFGLMTEREENSELTSQPPFLILSFSWKNIRRNEQFPRLCAYIFSFLTSSHPYTN